MKNIWKSCTVQDIQNIGEAELKTGPFGTQLHASDYVEEGTPVINVRNIGFGSIRAENLEFISETTVQRLSSHLLKPCDIVFGRKGAVERHAFIQAKYKGWFQGSDCLRLRIKGHSVNPRFLSYCFLTESHQQWMMNQCSHGSTMASLNQAIISRIPLYLPSIDVQSRIVEVLSAYDDLIENNTRRIKILEEMAQLLYREWFVNFRFPGHEEVKLVESPIGLIPEGWEMKTIGDVTSYINRGIAPKYDDQSEHTVINQKCIRNGRLTLDFSRRQIKKVPPEKVIHFGDVLVNSTGIGTLGRIAQVYQQLSNCSVDSHVSIVRPSNLVNCDYFGWSLLQLQEYFENMGTGSTGQTELSRQSIGETNFLLPPRVLQDKFGDQISPMRYLITNLTIKNKNLRQTRDLLLPKLISGEIEVEAFDLSSLEPGEAIAA